MNAPLPAPTNGLDQWSGAETPRDRLAVRAIAVARRLGGAALALVRFLGSSFGGAMLIPSWPVGLILLAAVAQNPRHLVFALIGILVAEGVGLVLGLSAPIRAEGALRANAILASIASAWLTAGSELSLPAALLFSAIVAAVASLLAAAFSKALTAAELPSLSLSFSLIFGVFLTVFPFWAARAVSEQMLWPYPVGVSGWIDSFLRSMGMIVFSPDPRIGLCVAIAIIAWSRSMFLAGLVGWVAGIATALFAQQVGLHWFWLTAAHSYFIAGMLLGSVFFLPGRAALVVAAVAGSVAALVAMVMQSGLQGSGWAFLPLPALLTVWIGTQALGAPGAGHPLVANAVRDRPPEEAWWRAAYRRARYQGAGPLLVTPVAGVVAVTQSFDGPLSHRGLWRHGLDFERPRAGLDAPGNGAVTWGMPVVSPAAGIVELVQNGVVDNPLGVCNYAQSWGNFVVIRMDHGQWVMLAHFMQGSIAVAQGMRVEIGTYLGQTGNSGRSPVPHLHMQAQAGPQPGTPTVPFRLANYLGGAAHSMFRWNGWGVPAEGDLVCAATPHPVAWALLASFAPGLAIWRVDVEGSVPRAFVPSGATERVRISLDSAGSHILRSSRGGFLNARMDLDAWRVDGTSADASALLRLIALAIPSVPYAAAPGVTWNDVANVAAVGVFARLSLSPYFDPPFPVVECRSQSASSTVDAGLLIETRVIAGSASLPVTIVTRIDRIRGPVYLEARFAKGTARYALISFEPLAPTDAREGSEGSR